MGEEGWRRLLADREALVEPFRRRLRQVAEDNGERLLESGGNTISFAITLDTLVREQKAGADDKRSAEGHQDGARPAAISLSASLLGSMLFTRCVSGTRVVARGQRKSVAGVDFEGYGASVGNYPHDYLTAACAIGLSTAELDEFVRRLDKTIRKVKGCASKMSREGGRAVGAVNGVEGGGVANEGLVHSMDRARDAEGLILRDTSQPAISSNSSSGCGYAPDSGTVDWDGVD